MYWTRKETSGKNWAWGVCDPMPKFGASIQNGFEREPQGPEVHANRVNFGEIFTRSSKDSGAIPIWEPFQIGSLSELRAIPNGSYSEWRCFFEYHASLHSHYECVAISNGFHECWPQAWEPLWKGASPCPGLLEGFRIFRLNPETDTPPKTLRFHAKSHSKSEDFPFCDQMPLGDCFKRHCAR